MERGRLPYSRRNILAFFAVLALLGAAAWADPAEVIFSFGGGNGEYPATDLVMDAAGNLYGTTVQGGDIGAGTVFKLTPSRDGWTQTVLYSFTGGADGGQPYNGVTLDAQGNLYGTGVVGGTGGGPCEDGCGVVYKLTNSGGSWSQSVLYSFTGGNDGSGPGAGLTFDDQGNLYGMTPTYGAYGLGTIYQLKPGPNGTWSFRVIHAFTGGNDGASASAGRLLFDAGSLYGVATVGGANGKGTVFKLSPAGDGRWKLRTLYAFKGQPDAGLPYGALIRDAAGNLYGTTYWDGANGIGAVYQLTPNGGEWKERVLYSFNGGSDGSFPISHLVLGAAGDLYGTTSEGGAPGCGCGTIFKLSPVGNGRWQESVVYSFQGTPDAAFSYNGMVADPSGSLFGSTVHGGEDNDGAIYKFTP